MTQQIGPLFDGTYNPDNDQTVKAWGTTYDAIERGVTNGIDGQSFASVRTPAWHNLGVLFDHSVPALELLQAAKADFEVFTAPLFASAESDVAKLPELVATCRRDEHGMIQPLGVVSTRYQIHQTVETFIGFGDAILETGDPCAASCGVLNGGRRVFMSWKLPRQIMVGGVDGTELWLTMLTSFDGSTPTTALISPIRTVCQNTVRYNLRHHVTRWSVRHTRNSKMALADVRNSLQLTNAYADQWELLANRLVNTKLPTATFEEIITKAFGPKAMDEEPTTAGAKRTAALWDTKRNNLLDLFVTSPTQENVRGTAWAAVQAVGEYQDWELEVRGVRPGDEPAARFTRSMFDDSRIVGPKMRILRDVAELAGVPAGVLA